MTIGVEWKSPLPHTVWRGGILLDSEYPVFFENKKIGTAWIRRFGLYYHIGCSCDSDQKGMFKIVVSNNDKIVNLGTCIPKGDRFGLKTQIPVKYLGEGTFSFCAVTGNASEDAGFVPVSENEPFDYLVKLNEAYLYEKDGVQGIRFWNRRL